MKRHLKPMLVMVVSLCSVAFLAGQAMGQATSFTSMGYRATEGGGGAITSEWTTGNLGNTWSEGEWVPYQLVIVNVQNSYEGLVGLPDIVMSYDFTRSGNRFVDLVRSIQVGTTELTDDQGWPMDDGTPYPDLTRLGIEDAQNDVGNADPLDNEWTTFSLLNLPESQINRAHDGGLNHPDSAESTFFITLADLLATGLDPNTETIVIYYQLHESRTFVWENSLQEQYDAYPTNAWGGYLYSTGLFPTDARLGSGYVPGSSGHIEVEFATGSKTVPIPIPETLPGEVTGLKWHDYNGDGIIDGGEPTIAGWPIHVSGTLENIFFETSTVTDGLGLYSFPSLTSGVTWTIKEDDQLPPEDTWAQTYPSVGTIVLPHGTGAAVFPPPPGVADVGWEVDLTLATPNQADMDFGNRLCEVTCIDPSDTTVYCDENTDPSSLGWPIVEGNCTPIDTSYSDEVSGHCPTTIVRTWIFTDIEGNQCISDQVITVIDDIPPTISCPPDVVFDCVMGDPGTAEADDNCFLADLYFEDVVLNDRCPYQVERTWTAVDSCDNTASCVQLITVEDTVNPEFTYCPPDVVFDCVMGDPGTATATDNCYLEDLSFDDVVLNDRCPYEVERTWTATDSCGNQATCVQRITVEDTTDPEFTYCPPDVVFDCVMGDPGTATATDNCYLEDLSFDDVVLNDRCPYEVERTWTATDSCGNQATCVQRITVEDTTDPEFTYCPPDVVFDCVMGDPGMATATDNCYLEDLSYDDVVLNARCPYEVERTWTATDSCGNQATCVQLITVEDTTDPVFTYCPADLVLDCDASGDYGTAEATDNCYLADLSYDDIILNDRCPLVVERTWTATDSCGNFSTCVQNITIRDITPPELTCPSDITFDCVMGDPGVATAFDVCAGDLTPTFSDFTVNDRCPVIIERTWYVEDTCGNSNSCVQTITIEDTTNPFFTFAPPDVVFDCVMGDPGTATADDNCYLASLDFEDFIQNDRCPLVIERVWTAMDSCDNMATHTQMITVQDITAPELTCPPDITFDCVMGDPGVATAFDVCAGDLTPTFSDITVSDRCPVIIERTWYVEDTCGNPSSCVQTITIEDTTDPYFTNAPGDIVFDCVMGDPGTATADDNCYLADLSYEDVVQNPRCPLIIERTWTAIDSCENTASYTQMITVQDITPPELTCPPNITFDCVMGDAGVATAWDACMGDLTPTFSDFTVSERCPVIIERTWYVEDTCGNPSSCMQVITIEDNTDPEFTYCPEDILFLCEMGDPGTATATDNCYLADLSYDDIVINDRCPIVIERTWTAVDSCDNMAYCVQIITVEDTTSITWIDFPPDVVYDCQMGDPGAAFAQSACGILAAVPSDNIISPRCPLIIERTWEVIDSCGHQLSGMQTITVQDTAAPQITCPPDIVFDCEIGDPGVAVAVDQCGIITPTYDDNILSERCPLIIERTWTAEDTCGNLSSCMQMITVQDTVKPEITCPPDTVFDCVMGDAGVATAVDACVGDLTPTYADDTTSERCPLIIERTWTAIDTCSNEISCIQTITVQDTLAPALLTCAEDTTIDCESEVVFTPPTAEDNCVEEPELIVLPMDTAMGTNPGDTIFTQCWVFTDTCGNVSDTCCQAITKEACPQEFCTFTMGGWGSGCPLSQVADLGSTQPGCIRDHFFDLVFPSGVTIGHPDYFTAHFTSASAVEYYLPAGGKARVLGQNWTDPSSKQAGGVLGGQILALTLNREYAVYGVFDDLFDHGGFLGGFEIPDTCSNMFAGLTVDSFLVIANYALGGNTAVLDDFGAKLSDVNFTATCLNEYFDECELPPALVYFGDDTEALPLEYGLGQNYPNPFNPTTEFSFTLPKPSHVRLVVYNITGRVVTTVTEGQYSAGYHTVVWNASNTASGVYFYRLEADNFVASKKMVLLK